MAVNLSSLAGAAAQLLDNNANMLSGGKIYTYVAGTTTPQATYTTQVGNVAHSNPIILDAAGRVPGNEIWLTSAVQYKFIIKTSDDVLLVTCDNISGINDAALTTIVGFNGLTGTVSSLTTATGADWIGYTPTGTSATPRSVQNKLRDTISIKDFGAVCDGITNDAVAVQAAIDSVPDYTGARITIPANTAIGSSITIANKKGLILQGDNGQGFGFVGGAFTPTFKWIGAAGGKMFAINNVLNLTMSDMIISGNDTADYGLYFEGSTSGWGVSNYNNLTVIGCNKNAVYKGRAAGAPAGNDFGRNHWVRCTFRNTHAATGTAKNDAIYTYENDSGVQDVFDHCEWIYTSSGTAVTGGYAVWFEAGTPRVHFRDCYTKAENGIFVNSSGATPKLYLYGHYSEDLNFISLASAATRQVLEQCVHVLGGGASLAWAGAAGSGAPLVIDGGVFYGSVSITNVNAPVIFANSPEFVGGYPTISNPEYLVQFGRSQGSSVAATETHGAYNGAAFVSHVYANVGANINPSLRSGTTLTHTLTQNTLVNAPTTVDANGLDVGREIWLKITGDATVAYTVTFNAIYKLAGGAYTHSGATKTDILKFVWDGTNWWETSRSMNMV